MSERFAGFREGSDGKKGLTAGVEDGGLGAVIDGAPGETEGGEGGRTTSWGPTWGEATGALDRERERRGSGV